MVGLLPELLQQVRYEGINILEDVIRIAEKNEASLEPILILLPKDTTDVHLTPLRTSSSATTFFPSNMPSKIEAAMKN